MNGIKTDTHTHAKAQTKRKKKPKQLWDAPKNKSEAFD